MDLLLDHTIFKHFNSAITITGSKSESNRLLILQQLFNNLYLENLSNSVDTLVLKKALLITDGTVDIGHAGTAMRFLTAYFATVKGVDITLTGSDRMQKRPIKILVDALKSLDADITYLNKVGFPPLRIKGKTLLKDNLTIKGDISSQYISALLLIAPSLKNGFKIKLISDVISVPYIKMTLSLLHKIGIDTSWIVDTITVLPKKAITNKTVIVESDWSSASYYYSFIALSNDSKVNLSQYYESSLQGDSALTSIYENFGVKTTFTKKGMLLEKTPNFKQKKHLQFNLINTPDIAQTIAVTCLGLGVSCGIIGLQSLKIKETDRLVALKTELEKFGAKVRITQDSLHIKCTQLTNTQRPTVINTYDDHRMAMAFAPLSLIRPITIKNAEVVKKSYPNYWKDINILLKNKK